MASFDLATVTRGVRALQALDVSRIVGLLRGIPTALKYLVMFVFLLNIKVLAPRMALYVPDFLLRIWRPALLRQFQHRMLKLRTMFYSKEKQIRLEDEWYNSITPIGAHPLVKEVSYRAMGQVSLDESDFNGHLSNSSYAKAAIVYFPNLFRERGWIPLAATHFHFIREIPILGALRDPLRHRRLGPEVVLHRPPVRHQAQKEREEANRGRPPPATVSRTAVGPEELSGNGTPVTSASTNSEGVLKSVSNIIASQEHDGATLHTIVCSQLCFKVGRITIPQSSSLLSNGFSGVPGDEAKPFTATNPPPHWETVEAMALKSLGKGGGRRPMAEFLKGGWRDVPEEKRWWTQAYDPIREKLNANLAQVDQLKRGLEGARHFEIA
ncbi:hypothetical protein FA13DRAFT_1766607 [Coprinellus micaceus]|uniref:Uncharacterized protein n=1 Tax=Coprinellus micaceus TaxID=71717 RepID=A0A4Y7SJA9_COPMI|nr:hypothetical protein FA13DRAFT_1766607 [Coprinellus micaceus]